MTENSVRWVIVDGNAAPQVVFESVKKVTEQIEAETQALGSKLSKL